MKSFDFTLSFVYTRVSQPELSPPFEGHEQRSLPNSSAVILQNPKQTGIFWWAGARMYWESLEGGHKPWKFENHWPTH